MFFFDPKPTPYDLNWRMFGIPVRVHPTFWLLAAFMGWNYMRLGIGIFLLWIACMFVSILVHELGHVFAARVFGEPSQIVLYGLGGVAMGQYQRAARWQRILILFAGPGAGFALYGLARLIHGQIDMEVLDLNRRLYVFFLFDFLFFMNLLWSFFNLVPVNYAALMQFQGGSEPGFSARLKQILRRNVAKLVRDNRAAERVVRREQFLDETDGSISVTWLQPTAKLTSPYE